MKGIILLTAVSFILLGCATPRVVEVTATPEPTAPPLAAQTAIIVPQGNPPAIDGTISPVEWDDASIETFAEGSELLLMHADGYLYLGILVNTPGSAGIPAIAILRRRNAMRSSSRGVGWLRILEWEPLKNWSIELK